MLSFETIPKEAIERIRFCTTAEEIKQVADEFDVPFSMEEAEAMLMDDDGQLSDMTGCGLGSKSEKKSCSNCEHGIRQDRKGYYVYKCSINGLITVLTFGGFDPGEDCPLK